MEPVRFPQYLSNPIQVLWAEADSFGVFFLCLCLALSFDGWFLWILTIAIPWGYSRVKKNYPRGFLKHSLYYLSVKNFKGYPEYHQKKFRE